MAFSKSDVETLKALVQDKQKKWAIVPHLNPDGDAMGSSLAFQILLDGFGVTSNVLLPDATPEFLSFMPGIKRTIVGKRQPVLAKKTILEADVLLLLDHNDFKRSGNLSDTVVASNAQKIVIDHHPEPIITKAEALMFSVIASSSTCELVLELIEEMGFYNRITTNLANALMTGMVTDTGAFSYNCSQGSFFVHIAHLLDKGADKDGIIDKIYNQQSEDRMRLVGYLLSEKMEVFPEIRTAIISLNWAEMHRFNFKKGDSEGVVNMPLAIRGIDLSIFISVRDDKTKLSLRSKGDFPANKIAAKFFSGGGHLNAAGGSSEMPVDDTVKYFKTLFPDIKSLLKK